MIKISETANAIKPSLTRKLFNMAKEYNDVIDFTLGDPDVPTPLQIKEAGCKAIMEGKTRYSQNAGLIELREAISKNIEFKEGIKYNPHTEVMATVGAMEGLYLALLSVIDEGDEVIIPAPYYVNYGQMVSMCKGMPVIVEDMNEVNTLRCSLNAIKNSVTSKTKAIILNTPCNPTGMIMSKAFIEGIADIAKERNLVVLTDEVYKCLVYKKNAYTKSIANLAGMQERTIYINSMSKEYCMTGWRIGYVCGPSGIIAAMTKLQENIAACAPLPSQYAAIEALRIDRNYSGEMANIFTTRRNVLIEEFNKIPLLKCLPSDATFYAMVNIEATGLKSEEFAYKLLKQSHVAVVPGITYGKMCDNYIRIAFTLSDEKIMEGVRRIGNFVSSL